MKQLLGVSKWIYVREIFPKKFTGQVDKSRSTHLSIFTPGTGNYHTTQYTKKGIAS